MQNNKREDSRKSHGKSTSAQRRRMMESPDMFRNVANQSLNQNVNKMGTPMRGAKKLGPNGSRPSSA
jgi:hypothetical protein